MRSHIESIHEKVKYPCGQCEYKATGKGHLKTHILAVHEKIKYPCQQCEYKATSKGSLKTHIESVHEKVKHPCNLCGKQFSGKGESKRHNMMYVYHLNTRSVSSPNDWYNFTKSWCSLPYHHPPSQHGKVDKQPLEI